MQSNGGNHSSVQTIPRVRQDLRSVCNQEGAIVLDVKHGQIYRLNSAGAMVFEGIEKAQHPEQIADALITRFGIMREIAQADIRAFTARLQAGGLIE